MERLQQSEVFTLKSNFDMQNTVYMDLQGYSVFC